MDDTLWGGYITQGYNATDGKGGVRLPYFDESFLNTPVKKLYPAADYSTPLGSIYRNYKFKFTKNTDGYYEYNSRDDSDAGLTAMGLKLDGRTFTAGDKADGYTTIDDAQDKSGFFPIRYIPGKNYTNFCYGAKFEIDFTMSSTGTKIEYDTNTHQLKDTNKAIEFTFSGDDDVWVYIDGYLVLDVGGPMAR